MLDVEKLNLLGECTKQSDGRNGANNCKDTGSNCLVLAKRGFCELNLYQEIMRDMCTLSCGYCPPVMEYISYDERQSRENAPMV
uniref:ShKT domain-containing protein n=1 Tax=Ascaris lumbricoides TaxID=6252 RepID=A0A0M3HN53_ASCLU